LIRNIYLFAVFSILAAVIPLGAQERNSAGGGMSPGLRRRALVLNIDARVLDTSISNEEQNIVWNETHRREAIPGSPVGIQLVGSNVVVSVQFTPFVRRRGPSVLVAQGQIWIDDPDRGICYYTSIQTIPMEFGEPIYFFPLGSAQELDSSIEIILTVNPYSETDVFEEAAVNTEDE
jgi:hypothetical protein